MSQLLNLRYLFILSSFKVFIPNILLQFGNFVLVNFEHKQLWLKRSGHEVPKRYNMAAK